MTYNLTYNLRTNGILEDTRLIVPLKTFIIWHQAYFTDGSVLGEGDLLSMAEAIGISRDDVKAAITSESKQQEALQAALSWSSKGVSGENMFIHDYHVIRTCLFMIIT